ncbi:hypothetical protein F7731_08375 [Cytobacillus depressus]|uniref:Uncharacterized protein n=1 Tax=Cytobacillus depressus TaxID=1602942 RepID=A0A6L3V8C8_9BACI|nr:hypothetical protein [Cytobacillus depressus]KAB2337606.1 hypothetical protein F7731_08375 [Cytobacillus depressus]
MIRITMQIDLFREIIVDNFAGGGGASTGIEEIAINHDPAAIAMQGVRDFYVSFYEDSEVF